MSETPENPLAFPVSTIDGFTQHGMSLREWYAGQALPAVIYGMMSGVIGDHPEAGGGPAGFAATANDIADAMLLQREKEGKRA